VHEKSLKQYFVSDQVKDPTDLYLNMSLADQQAMGAFHQTARTRRFNQKYCFYEEMLKMYLKKKQEQAFMINRELSEL